MGRVGRGPTGRFTRIEPPGATSTKAGGINNRGEIVGNYATGGTVHGFLRDRKGRLIAIDRPGAAATYLSGINDRGQVVGISGYSSPDALLIAPRAFVLSRGAYRALAVPGAASTTANDINNRGEDAGAYNDAAGMTHGFLRGVRDGYLRFDHPDATTPGGTAAYNLNDRGQIAGAYTSRVR